MSVYDNNGSNFPGGRGCDRRFGAQRRTGEHGEGDYRMPNGVFDIERALKNHLSVAANSTPCNPDSNRSCDFNGLASGSPALAMVYCPRQYWRAIHSPDEALKKGTLFSELHMPFEGDKMR